MIFASVGSMLPFDRFVRAIDEWARDHPDDDVFIQIGAGDYEPRHAPFARQIPMAEYRQRLADCDLFIAHVGMGSILQALEAQKQMLLMKRDFALGEHTTDHQTHTAAQWAGRPGIRIVLTVEELQRGIDEMLAAPIETAGAFSVKAPAPFAEAVATFLSGGTPQPL